MISIPQLHTYYRQLAHLHHEAVAVPPFTLFFDLIDTSAGDAATGSNFALPDIPCGGDLREPLDRLRAVFRERNQKPDISFLNEFAPDLPAALQAAGFVEKWRSQIMICIPETFRPAPHVPGLTIKMLSADSSIADVQENLNTNIQGFDPHQPPVSTKYADDFRRTLVNSRAFTALLDGVPAGAGMLAEPFDGISELAGITTLAPFRRRGIASFLTTHMVQAAFDHNIQALVLGAANEDAGRIYEQVGFRPFALMLAYGEPSA